MSGSVDPHDSEHEGEQEDEHGRAIAESEAMPMPTLVVRGAIGGVLMGLANLVPGISGGTMLLAAGVYPLFIESIAEITTLRFRAHAIVALGTIAASAAVAILLLAGGMKTLVVEERWIMYSLFIGLTLGGVPLVWRLAQPATPALWLGAAASFAVMVVMSLGGTQRGGDEASTMLLTLSGLAGASAMILPGVSGGYLLLLLGQYEPILGAIDSLKSGLLGSNGGGFDLSLVMQAMQVVVPVGIGVVIGIVGVSNLLRWLLDRYEKPTLGVLLGLLVGSVVGLYPFQAPVPPEPGHVHRGATLSAEAIEALDEKYWPLERYTPAGGEAATALALILAGLASTLLVDRIGGGRDDSE
jgi:putative membrane protein